MSQTPIRAPGRFAPVFAVAFADTAGESRLVGAAEPLPVTISRADAPAALNGTMGASGETAAYATRPGVVWITLAGNWTGSVQLLRSVDGGITRLPITLAGQPWGSFTANVNEAVVDEAIPGATYTLAATISGGTLSYRIAQ